MCQEPVISGDQQAGQSLRRSGQKVCSPNLGDHLRWLIDRSRYRYLFLPVDMVYLK
ncbi:hypothetical protein [Levilactobacillus yiduensis]|uniref:hypothetical protein n=1 Tax=Levilactobacillus yiduensis TaxID=2953880 RepID=UPI0021586617|nr:hypothetical protein [Levilactobacillus yiduensis]